jgi:hypothetical protein
MLLTVLREVEQPNKGFDRPTGTGLSRRREWAVQGAGACSLSTAPNGRCI